MQKELPAFTYVENDYDLEMICNKLSSEQMYIKIDNSSVMRTHI